MNFTLTITPDGRALLTTPNDLSPDEAKAVMAQWDHWKETPQGVAIIASCDLKHVQSHDIELAVPA